MRRALPSDPVGLTCQPIGISEVARLTSQCELLARVAQALLRVARLSGQS